MTSHRLAIGGRIDRARPLDFTFDGRRFAGYAGDTLAAALLANGVRLVGRSFKYHRPRGIVTAGPEEPCALVELGTGAAREPNTAATTIELADGLVAASQNRFPSLRVDLRAVNDWLAPLLPAGFYYKTFMAPTGWWERVYEPAIRRAAGLGRAPEGADPARYETRHDHCDVLVVGSGAAGLAAARRAAEAGARVVLCEQDFELGGGTLLEPSQSAWRDAMVAALARCGEATVLARTTVVGFYDHGVLAAIERRAGGAPGPRQRLRILRARHVVLATGALERLIALPDNDRPGVMLAGAALAYLRRYAVVPGRRAVLFTNNDAAYASAHALAAAGVAIAAIVDPRTDSHAAARATAAGLPVRLGGEVVGTAGRLSLHGVRIRRRGAGHDEYVSADLLCLSGGHTPQLQLAAQSRATMRWDDAIQAFVPERFTQAAQAAGAARGAFGFAAAARDGDAAGRAALVALGLPPRGDIPPPADDDAPASPLCPLWEVAARGKSFVDLQHDVTAADLRLADREGYRAVEHAKRYTTHGMGTDQGKIGGLVGSAVLAAAQGRTVAEVGVPTSRPFVTPATWGALAGAEVGRHFKPERRLVLHDWHAARGAVFVRVGLWMRPLVYSPSGDTSWAPVLEEARAVRRAVGLTDASSFGKIDVQGPDAATFLDRIYANTFSTLPVGRARYGLMLREDGIVFDDGTTARLAPDHFVVTTTTAKATEALEHLEWHLHTAWPELDVVLTNVADHWAQFAVAGPRSRDVLARIVDDRDLANDAFPFMAAGPATIAGVAGRLFRISFSGELAYEVAVPATHALPVWEAILAAGESHGIRPYGLDALNVLRIEKGHVTGGEINGQTTAADLGLGRMLKQSGDFVGRTLVQRPAFADPDRLQLVGLRPVARDQRLRGGAHFVAARDATRSQGYVTAACMAAEGDGWIGLGLLAGGARRHGERLVVAYPVLDEAVEVEITAPHVVDPENRRVRA